MPDAILRLVEGDATPPPADPTGIIAFVGTCTALASGSVAAFDSPAAMPTALGKGVLAEVLPGHARTTKRRTLACALPGSVPGSCGAVTQSGTGPAVTASGAPYDSRTVVAKISTGGGAGTAKFRLSVGQTLVGTSLVPAYGAEIEVPSSKPAALTGTVDLTTLDYATAAKQTGTVDLTSAALYGVGGTLGTKTVVVDFDGAGAATTVTLANPANVTELLSQLNGALAGTPCSVNAQNKLVIESATYGATSEVDLTGGTALSVLGLSVATVNGVDGDLDGLTLILDEESGVPQTITFGNPPNATAVATAVSAATNITATVFGAANRLRVATDTTGATATLSITGGTGRTALGLPLGTATGSGAGYLIADLGVTLSFGSGTYVAGTTYTVPCYAPGYTVGEVEDAIDAIVASKEPFELICIAQEIGDATDTLALATACAAKVAEYEAQGVFFDVLLGVPWAESDTNAKDAFASFESRDVAVFGRGMLVTLASGGAGAMRSQAIIGARKAARDRFSSDLGNHQDGNLSSLECLGLPAGHDESLATTKLRSFRFCVAEKLAAGVYFSRGLTMAPSTSSYRDLNVTRVIKDGARVVKPLLDLEVNSDPVVKTSGALASPEPIDASLTGALRRRLIDVPSGQHPHASAAAGYVDRTYDVAGNRRLPGTIKVKPNGQVESVEFTIMATKTA